MGLMDIYTCMIHAVRLYYAIATIAPVAELCVGIDYGLEGFRLTIFLYPACLESNGGILIDLYLLIIALSFSPRPGIYAKIGNTGTKFYKAW